jgi:DNA mismatch repair protein MutL
MKAAIDQNGIARQILLIPEIVEFDQADVERLLARTSQLNRFGLAIELVRPRRFIAVRETPSMLGEIDGSG